jgi:hypothetical protein
MTSDLGDEDEDAAYEAAVGYHRRVATELDRLRVHEDARILLGADTRPPLPTPISLSNALTVVWPDDRWLIDGLMPREGIVMLSAPQKAGKTTAVGCLVRSLVDGDKYFDAFVVPDPVRVVLLDTESGERRLYEWLGDQQIRRTDQVTTVSLRGCEGALDPRDRRSRAEWVAILAGHDVVILDVVGPVLAALGLDESSNADVGAFWVGWRSLLTEAGVSASVVVHHTGHDERRAIGASSWLRYPDVIWRIVREDEDPTSPRYFSAYGRDVEVYAGLLAYTGHTRRLVYTGQGPRASKIDRLVSRLVELLADHGPANATRCTELLVTEGASRSDARAAAPAGLRAHSLIMWRRGKSEIYGVPGVHSEAADG